MSLRIDCPRCGAAGLFDECELRRDEPLWRLKMLCFKCVDETGSTIPQASGERSPSDGERSEAVESGRNEPGDMVSPAEGEWGRPINGQQNAAIEAALRDKTKPGRLYLSSYYSDDGGDTWILLDEDARRRIKLILNGAK